jgi:hypothetical protein
MTTVNEGLSVDDGDDAFAAAFNEAVAGTSLDTAPAKKEEPVVDAAADAAKKAADEKAASDAAAATKAAADKAAADAARASETAEQTKAREDSEAAAKKAADDAEAKRKADEAAANTPAAIAAVTAKAIIEAQTKAAEDAAAKKAADEKTAADAAADAAARQLSAEEVTELDALKGEWKDIARLFELEFKKNSALADTAQGEAMKAVLKHIYGDIAPIAQSQKEMQETQHFNDIRTAHPDFDDVHPKLEPWINTQPAYLQKALKEVYTGGTAEEVNDLVQRFKDASGIVTPKADDVTTAPTTKKSEPDPKKVAALAPVDSQRSQVQDKGVDKNNFDAGWDEAMALASKK